VDHLEGLEEASRIAGKYPLSDGRLNLRIVRRGDARARRRGLRRVLRPGASRHPRGPHGCVAMWV